MKQNLKSDLPATVGIEPQWVKGVEPGRPVVWSVGPDRLDGGGVRVNHRFSNSDMVYVAAPMPERGR